METHVNIFTVLADEEKIKRKAAKKAQLDEDRIRRKQQKETEEKAQIEGAKWADVSDSSEEESEKSASVSTDETSDNGDTKIDIQITFGTKKSPDEAVATDKKVDVGGDDDFLNSLATKASSKKASTSPKPKVKAKKQQRVDVSEDPDVVLARKELETAEEELKKTKASDKQPKRALVQKAQQALKNAERRAAFKARAQE